MTTPVGTLGGVLNTGRQGIFANQIALRVTGQNIANVNTPGYTRQRPIFDPSAFGNGVSVKTIQQLRYKFLDAQLAAENETLGQLSTRQSFLAQLEGIFNESSGSGINTAMQDFFESIHDLTAHPEGTAQREAVRTRGGALANVLNAASTRLNAARRDADNQVTALVTTVNGLAREIAQLNDQIKRVTTAEQPANELLDQRQLLVNQLSELINIDSFESDGALTILVAGGQPLVDGVYSGTLTAETDATNGGMSRLVFSLPGGALTDVTDRVTGGRIGGLISVRDGEILRQIRQIDQLAATFMSRFNVQHQAGTGLDGITGRNFFNTAAVTSTATRGSTGNVTQTAGAILDQSALTFHDYEIRFTSGTTYDLVDTTTGATLAAGAAYTSGNAIVFGGLSLTLSSTGGPPAAGDVLRVNTYDGAATDMALDPAIAASLQAIGAGLSAEPGDNRNALALANLESAMTMSEGSATFSNFYEAAVTSLGVVSRQASTDLDAQSYVVEQVSGLIDSIGGVSIDEESTNLIQYERAFQASARIITAVDDMMQTIIQML